MNEYKFQVSDAKDGRIIVARNDSLDELCEEFEAMRSMLFLEEPQVETIPEEPFTDDGVIPFKKKDGSTGYKVKEGTIVKRCPKCKGTDMQIREGQYGPYWSCQDCYRKNTATYINIDK